MLKYNMTNIDERKQQMISLLAKAPRADTEVPPIDRILIADLVMAGVKKMMDSVTAHMEMVAPSLHTEASMHAFVMMQMMEISSAASGVVEQLGMQSERGMREAASQMPASLVKQLLAEAELDMEPYIKELLHKRLKELGL
jgi:hypothetical protein